MTAIIYHQDLVHMILLNLHELIMVFPLQKVKETPAIGKYKELQDMVHIIMIIIIIITIIGTQIIDTQYIKGHQGGNLEDQKDFEKIIKKQKRMM